MRVSWEMQNYDSEIRRYGQDIDIRANFPYRFNGGTETTQIRAFEATLELAFGYEEGKKWREHLAQGKLVRVTIETVD